MDSSWLLPGLAFFLLLALLVLLLRPWRERLRRRAIAFRAARAERGAEDLLRAAGYEVIERQVRGEGRLWVDGRWWRFEVRADLLVERRAVHPWLQPGDRLVVEVKTGARGPDPFHPPTRRQLLEYLQVFQPDGVLLVDMEQQRIVEIGFPA